MISQVEQQIKTKNRINTLKIVSVFLIIGFIFVGLSFAKDAGTQKIDDLAKIAHFLVSFLSRGRALLATLAGKLMSNDLIYGSFMHLDIFLRKTRNIMKNFANYTLGFMFLYMIIKSLIDKEGANDVIKKKLVGFVLAGVLIQASRFLIGAVIDISTIAVTAIGAIPGQIIQSDIGVQKKLGYINAGGGANLTSTGEILTGIVMTFDPNKKLTDNEQYIVIEPKTLDRPITQDNYLDMILPSYNTISGPLIFFGTSIFQFQDYSFSNPSTTSSWKRLMEFALNLLIIVIYSLAMLALVILNFFRIFFLWLVIIFSPFIMLLAIFTSMKIIPQIKGMDVISIGNVLKLIFKPVIFMAYISIMMIFVIGVRAMLIPMNGGDVKLNEEVTINSQMIKENSWNSSIKSDGIFNFSVNGAKNSIADLIVYFITLFLLRFLLKTAVSSGSGMTFVDDKLKKMTTSAENIAGQIPIVPIAGGVGVNSVFGSNSDSLINKAKNSIGGQMSEKNMENMKDAFPKLYGDAGINYDLEKSAIDTNNPERFRTDAQSFASSNGGISYTGTSEGSRAWVNAMQTRFDANKDKKPGTWKRESGINLDKFIELNYLEIDKKMGGTGVSSKKEFEKKPYGEATDAPDKNKEKKE
ncbi:MAG: hypothetical protein WAZ12_03880 [Candidatus Absconditicoccaceae bacterium]